MKVGSLQQQNENLDLEGQQPVEETPLSTKAEESTYSNRTFRVVDGECTPETQRVCAVGVCCLAATGVVCAAVTSYYAYAGMHLFVCMKITDSYVAACTVGSTLLSTFTVGLGLLGCFFGCLCCLPEGDRGRRDMQLKA